MLPAVAASLAESHPDLQLEIHEGGCDLELIDRVARGELDLTFCVLPARNGTLATEELLDDPYLLLVPSDSPLREASAVPLERLGSLPLIGYRGCRTEERVVSYLRGLGIDLDRVAYADDNAIIQAMVAGGRGAAVLTHLSIDHGGRPYGDAAARRLGAAATDRGRLAPRAGDLTGHPGVRLDRAHGHAGPARADSRGECVRQRRSRAGVEPVLVPRRLLSGYLRGGCFPASPGWVGSASGAPVGKAQAS